MRACCFMHTITSMACPNACEEKEVGHSRLSSSVPSGCRRYMSCRLMRDRETSLGHSLCITQTCEDVLFPMDGEKKMLYAPTRSRRPIYFWERKTPMHPGILAYLGYLTFKSRHCQTSCCRWRGEKKALDYTCCVPIATASLLDGQGSCWENEPGWRLWCTSIKTTFCWNADNITYFTLDIIG